MMNTSLAVFDESIFGFIDPDFAIETLVDDCRFTEGPVWNKEGFYLFSDITANTIYKLVPGSQKEAFVLNSGTDNTDDEWLNKEQAGSNGLAYDKEGTLLVCRHGSHMVAKWQNNQLVPLVSSYQDKPLNSPNDIIVDEGGRIFFSDPPYGLKEGKPKKDKFQAAANVYCFNQGQLTPICDKYQYPNGVCITPDGKSLYICSNKPFEKFVSVYDLATLEFQKILAEENSDGIKCDLQGNVYLSTKEGLLILNSEGRRLGLISFPTIPANHCFGGKDKTDLLVTGREKVYLVKNILKPV